ncbi:MAG TPA: hypothetical protein VGA78_18130, partial [Gemmatimonadales bacterium]
RKVERVGSKDDRLTPLTLLPPLGRQESGWILHELQRQRLHPGHPVGLDPVPKPVALRRERDDGKQRQQDRKNDRPRGGGAKVQIAAIRSAVTGRGVRRTTRWQWWGSVYEVFTIPKELRDGVELMDDRLELTGQGGVSVEERRSRATITFWGRTADGVGIEGTIHCQGFNP